MARLLAKAVNCLDEDVAQRPCNRCRICQAINEGRLLDLIEMDAASHTGVDNVREAIRDKVGFRPSEARYKVYVIDEVHMLSTSAFNALLKTLEEPPEHVIFCLATTEPHKILPTIVSRCQRFDFRRIPRSEMMARLGTIAQAEGIQIDDEALGFVARSATGSVRDAISLLDLLTAYGDERITLDRLRSLLGLSDIEWVYRLASCMVAHQVGQGLDTIDRAVKQGADVRQFAQQVIEYLRAALLVSVGGGAAATDVDARTRAELDTLVGQCSAHDLLRAIQLFNQAQLDLRGSDHGQLALELAFVEAALTDAALDDESSATRSSPDAAGQVLKERTPGAPLAPASEASSSTASQPQVVQEEPQGVPSAAVRPGAVPPPAPPRAPARAPAQPRRHAAESLGPEPQTEAISADYVARMRGEISNALRAEGPDGRRADGLFGTVFHIGEIKVLAGNEILFALPRGVFAQVSDRIDQVVERVLSSVLGRTVRARFVDKTRLAEYEPSPPEAPELAQPPSSDLSGSDQQGSVPAEGGASAQPADPYEEAKSDPLVQDLVRRGGQVTEVKLSSEE
jgi:DNA polymerase-3 subunit gamma/tau